MYPAFEPTTFQPKSHKLAKIIIPVILLLAVIGTVVAFLIINNNNSNDFYSSTDDLHIDMANWSYDEANNVYYQLGLVYASKPVDKAYESAGIYVPGNYFSCTEHEGKYSCLTNTTSKIGSYTADTAPIVMPIDTPGYSAQAAPTKYNYNKISSYLKAGYIYYYAGARGRGNAGAPWGVTDFKSAIRYYRYNSNNLPGNTNAIYAFGHSGGGAQSAILGASGDSSLYSEYLDAIGALTVKDDGTKVSDAINGVMAWCPITNLDVADAAYEWNMGQYSTKSTRADNTWTGALSSDLAEAYASYVNELKLTTNGTTLTLSQTQDGIYTAGSYYDYLKSTIETSLNNFLADHYDSASDMQAYTDKYSWVNFDAATQTATISSVGDFVKQFKNPSKNVGAFDGPDRKQAENYVFGNGDTEPLHFSAMISDLLDSKDYSKYSDYNNQYANDYASDLSKVDSLNKTSTTRQNMYNPMYFLSDYYKGYQSSSVASHWRIRSGIEQGDTATVTEMNLALALQNYNGVNVDFATVWAQGHTEAERVGNSTVNFINWVDEINESV